MADWADAADVVEIAVKGQAENQAVVNVFRWVTQLAPAAPNTGDLALSLNNFRTLWRTNYLPLVSNNYSVSTYSAQVIIGRSTNPRPQPSPIRGWTPFILSYGRQEVLAGGSSDVGTRGAASVLATFNAAGCRWVPAVRQRWARSGSRFYAGLESDTTNNVWNISAGFPGDAAAFFTTLVGGFTCNAGGDKLKLVAFGKTTYLKRPAGALSPWTYTAYISQGILNPYVTSQVSRKQRLRPQ